MLPYQCERCNLWHLSPKNRMTPSNYCTSCGKQGYDTEADARGRAAISKQEKKVELSVYQCPWGNGWHLSRSKH